MVSAGATSAATLPFVGHTTAEEQNEEERFVGVSYSPTTHKEQGKATGSLNFHQQSVSGTLEVGGFNIPIGDREESSPEERTETRVRYIFSKTEPAFTRDNKPLIVKLDRFSRNVGGYLTREGEYGKLAFILGPEEEGDSVEDVRGALPNQGRGRKNAPAQQMPNQGIPKRLPPEEYIKGQNNGGDE